MSRPTSFHFPVFHGFHSRTPAAPIRPTHRRPAPPSRVAPSSSVPPAVPSGRAASRAWLALGGRARAALLGVALMGGLALPAGNARALDVNRADASQLQTLRGIGPNMAQRILTERDRNGPFATLDALRERVRGIGEKTLQSLREAGLSAGAEQGASRASAAPAASPPAAGASSAGAPQPGKEGGTAAPTGRGRSQSGAAAGR